MADYDITEAFKRIENDLIASMIRNLDRHRAEEDELGIRWPQWQVEQLRALEGYKEANKQRFTTFQDINRQIDAMIRQAYTDGSQDQEVSILDAIKRGFRGVKRDPLLQGSFFRLNERKLEALIKATVSDMQAAETAVLRLSEDKYRSIIFNAQVFANTGAGSYAKAVDMATKDFLKAGLNCVQYKNGARHTLSDYADMAIKTASTRAYLQGEGQRRQEWGISTVIMNKRGNPCPKCLPFVGKVLIDDVWSGGSPEDGDYPLMSDAIAAGLYHPRCKDGHVTYFPEFDDEPDDRFTREEIDEIEERNREEAKLQYAFRQMELFGRLAQYSLDPENKKEYAAKEKEWADQVRDGQNYKPVLRGEESTVEVRLGESIVVQRVDSYDEIFISKDAVIKPRALYDIYKNTRKAIEGWSGTKKLPKIVILSFQELMAYGKYDAISDMVFFTPEIGKKGFELGRAYVECHEMWHKVQADKFRARGWRITRENYAEYLRELCTECEGTIDALGITQYNVGEVSEYAEEKYLIGRYDEVEAEYMTKIQRKREKK